MFMLTQFKGKLPENNVNMATLIFRRKSMSWIFLANCSFSTALDGIKRDEYLISLK